MNSLPPFYSRSEALKTLISARDISYLDESQYAIPSAKANAA